MSTRVLPFTFMLILSGACQQEGDATEPIVFDTPQKVAVSGYDGDIMEPFISRDGSILLFNNLNQPSVNTNIHWASRTSANAFKYEDEIADINTTSLEGVPTLSRGNTLYFVSTRSYDDTFSTIYQGLFEDGSVSGVELVSSISRNQAGWVNFDVEVSSDDEQLYFVDGRFDANGGPYEADIVIAQKFADGGFQRLADQSILQKVNTSDLEYAACISQNGLELYFTRVAAPITEASMPKIYVASRSHTDEPFGKPQRIEQIDGFVEGPTLSAGDTVLYYHKRENGKFALYMISKIS